MSWFINSNNLPSKFLEIILQNWLKNFWELLISLSKKIWLKLKQVVLCWRNLEKALLKLENEIKEYERWSYVNGSLAK